MKCVLCAMLLVFVSAAAFPQKPPEELGQGVFYSAAGDIAIGVDATIVDMRLKSPYIMFMAYVVAGHDKSYTVKRNDVVMVYKGQEYQMTPIKEVEEKYRQIREDIGLQRRFNKELLLFSKMQEYSFPYENEFFPGPGQNQPLAVNSGQVTGLVGFKTKLYFKNPGLAKGDELIIKIRDEHNLQTMGQVKVVIQ